MPDGVALKTWVVYPERKDKSGVVLVIHDINGMRDWPRALGDQLAQDGFIAIVPDFLSGQGPEWRRVGVARHSGRCDHSYADQRRDDRATERGDGIRQEDPVVERQDRRRRLLLGRDAQLCVCDRPARTERVGRVLRQRAGLDGHDAAPEAELAKVKAPVLGLYGGSDARINVTIPPTEAAMKKLNKSYEPHIFEGAGHGFLGNQAGQAGANLKAAAAGVATDCRVFSKALAVKQTPARRNAVRGPSAGGGAPAPLIKVVNFA